jgi:hypothetical protein
MSETNHINVGAFVSEREQEALKLAADDIARALSEATATAWTCDCVFYPAFEILPQGDNTSCIVTSLLPQLEKLEEPWSLTGQRLRTAYRALCAGDVPVFICTILRHVSGGVDPELAAAIRIRIRRLNLLAAEISRETGAYVIDLDRVLADIGARRFQTDYRLAGSALPTAGHFISLTLITNGLDAMVSFEIQEAARALVNARKPAVPADETAQTEITLKKSLPSLGQGRRKQSVATVSYTTEDNHAGWLVRQVLRGTISPMEALRRLVQAVRRRGVRESTLLLASGLYRQVSRRK